MIRVPASTFSMGSTVTDVLDAVAMCAREPLGHRCREELFSDELSRHRVHLSSFWLDRTEVTVKEYRRCAELGHCRALHLTDGARRFDRPRYPATFVSWEDARDYCRFRGARLPTEAEFERAARGTRGRRYPWGNIYNSHASNHGRLGLDTSDAGDGFAELAPVASFPAGSTPEGFLDLAGNAAEWVADRYVPGYAESAVVDPKGPPSVLGTAGRVVRGGHYGSAAPWMRGAARGSADPTTKSPHIGFRCARSETKKAPDAHGSP
jgi:formylglycine-generating enzyme required for sulfatase activity